MALYATPAGQRIPYDRNGSVLFWVSSNGTFRQADQTHRQYVNDETFNPGWDGGDFDAQPHNVGVIFPELWDLTGWYIQFIDRPDLYDLLSGFSWEYSSNTTNGMNGDWTTGGATGNDLAIATIDHYRTMIHTFSAGGVRAIKFIGTGFIAEEPIMYTIHLYGQQTAGANPDSLRVWYGEADLEYSTVIDYGDVSQGHTYAGLDISGGKRFRIKNLSPIKTASGVIITTECLTDASPSFTDMISYSTDGFAWAKTINIGDLAPGQLSNVIYIRNIVNAEATLWLRAMRVVATPTDYL